LVFFYLRFEATRDPTNITITNEDTTLAATIGPTGLVFNCVPGNPVLDGVAVAAAELSSLGLGVEFGSELELESEFELELELSVVGVGEGF